MTDATMIEWAVDRLVCRHGENENCDYIIRLRRQIEEMREKECRPCKPYDQTASKLDDLKRRVEKLECKEDWRYYPTPLCANELHKLKHELENELGRIRLDHVRRMADCDINYCACGRAYPSCH